MSDTTKLAIQPKQFSKEATIVEIEVNGFKLNSKTGVANAIFKTEQGEEIQRKRIVIPEQVFTVWGTDDKVIQDFVFAELGVEAAK